MDFVASCSFGRLRKADIQRNSQKRVAPALSDAARQIARPLFLTAPLHPAAEIDDATLAARLHPRVAKWFRRTYARFTPAQRLCIPAILDGRSVLLSSPTGSGKTLAGFLGIIDWLVRHEPSAGSIYGIYISPLRSLTYDIQKNLTRPLQEMGLETLIRVGMRTGDTPARERAAIRRRPPHLLLTTPESLAILLCQPAYHPALAACRFVVVDELHALAENKRGTHLSVSLERLERLRGPDAPPLCRVGLSATISPLEGMAGFLVGEGRPCVLARARTNRRALIEVYSPVRRDPYPPSGVTNGRVMHELAALVRSRRSVLIFTNVRSSAERLGLQLKAALPKLADKIEVHHSSLDRQVRLEVEDRLKNGELRAVVCSTSLEMGVDIGAIDLVVMISAPKGISRTLQRIGRSGHAIDRTSHGILVATNIIDLVECAVTARLARANELDPVRVPENAADVLAQHIVGLALEEPGIALDAVWDLVRAAWPYRRLTRTEFDRVVEYLEGGGRSLAQAYTETFGKVRVEDGKLFVASPRVGREYLVNVGTITSEGLVDVTLGRRRLGVVDENFIKGMTVGDVFVLGGRAVRLVEAAWQVARVEDAAGERPNVPAWAGSGRSLTSVLAREIARMRGGLDDLLRPPSKVRHPERSESASAAEDPSGRRQPPWGSNPRADVNPALPPAAEGPSTPWHSAQDDKQVAGAAAGRAEDREAAAVDWLVEEWELSAANAQAIVAQFKLQRRVSVVPRDGVMLIECYREDAPAGTRRQALSHYFFHTLIGRGANDALSRIVARRVARLVGGNAVATSDDYGFLLTLKRDQELPLEKWRACFARADAEDDLRAALKTSELIRWQFRAVAQTGADGAAPVSRPGPQDPATAFQHGDPVSRPGGARAGSPDARRNVPARADRLPRRGRGVRLDRTRGGTGLALATRRATGGESVRVRFVCQQVQGKPHVRGPRRGHRADVPAVLRQGNGGAWNCLT